MVRSAPAPANYCPTLQEGHFTFADPYPHWSLGCTNVILNQDNDGDVDNDKDDAVMQCRGTCQLQTCKVPDFYNIALIDIIACIHFV